jgi:hypothetical protein
MMPDTFDAIRHMMIESGQVEGSGPIWGRAG